MRLIVVCCLLLSFFLISSCATVQTKVDKKTKEEQDLLSVYIGKNIEEALIDFGQPFSDGLDEKGFRKVTFKHSKLGDPVIEDEKKETDQESKKNSNILNEKKEALV